MIDKVKKALRIVTDAFDSQINDLIEAAVLDLKLAGVIYVDRTDPLIIQAIITYVKFHFGEPSDPERIKTSYDEQKSQLLMSSNYGKMC